MKKGGYLFGKNQIIRNHASIFSHSIVLFIQTSKLERNKKIGQLNKKITPLKVLEQKKTCLEIKVNFS